MNTLNLVAHGAGLYDDEGLTVSTLTVPGAAEALDACANGKADICPIGIERIFTGYERGLHAQIFMAWASRYTYTLAVLDESPIRTLTDFSGATIGMHEIGPTSTGRAAVTSMLANAGLKNGEYAFEAIGFNNLDALMSKRVAGVGLPRYEMIPFQVAGAQLRIFENPILKDTPSGGYAAAPATIEKKGDALARFARAIAKAALLVRLNPAAAARLMLEANGKPFTGDDVDFYTRALNLWKNSLPAADPANARIGYLPPEGVEIYSKLLAGYGLTKTPVPVSAIITNQFNAFANDFDRQALATFAEGLR
jgi:NitT/TauT family transport system substrate-binding protein